MTTLHPFPFGIALGTALGVLSALCWIAVLVLPDVTLAHAWLGLFSTAPVATLRAGILAVAVSFIAGIVTGWLTAAVYNRIAGNRR